MFGFDFTTLPLAVNGFLFAFGAALVWIAGTRLALYADAIADRTGIGRAFLGLILLAGITELPECVTSISAVAMGNAPLAVNNLFGGIVMQTAILGVADALFGRGALSYFTPKPELLLEGVLLMILLALMLVGIQLGDTVLIAGIGWCTTLAFVLYLATLWLVATFEADKHWRPVDLPTAMAPQEVRPTLRVDSSWTLRRIWAALGMASAVILLAGSLLAASGDALAHQTNLGSSFVGATLLAGTTSLPELSTTIGAVRLGAYSMAFANIFGSNAIMIALLFVTDAVHREGPILAAADRSATFAATMGIVVTGIYLVGLIMRRHTAVLRMGLDSIFVLALYVLTVAGLFALRAG